MAKYSIFIRPDLTQVFWARMQAGDVISEAVALIDEQADPATDSDRCWRRSTEARPGSEGPMSDLRRSGRHRGAPRDGAVVETDRGCGGSVGVDDLPGAAP